MDGPATLYGALGDALGFALALGDGLERDYVLEDGRGVALRRGERLYYVEGERGGSRLRCVYEFGLTDRYEALLEHDPELFAEQRRSYGLDETADQEALASQRAAIAEGEVGAIDEEAVEAASRRLTDLFLDTTLRHEPLLVGDDEPRWDGFRVIGYLYPAEDDWGERVYDETVQRVLNRSAAAVDDVLDEVGVFDERPAADWDERGIR